jgi:hypothetical protein
MPLGLSDRATALLANSPHTHHTMHYVDGPARSYGPADRQAELATLTGHVEKFVAQGPFRPGNGLTRPPLEPEILPYHPYDFGGH